METLALIACLTAAPVTHTRRSVSEDRYYTLHGKPLSASAIALSMVWVWLWLLTVGNLPAARA